MDYHDHPFWTEQFEGDEAALRESNALVFTAEDFYEMGGDDEAREIMDLAMDRDMKERRECWDRHYQNEVAALRAENDELRSRLGEE